MIDVLVWNKYTRVVMQLAERLNISPEKHCTCSITVRYMHCFLINNIRL